MLPPKPHLIIERDQELKSVVGMLLLEGSSRIAILGGGVIGKTTTALAALHNPYIAMRYSSRYFLSCESILSVEGLLTGILNILGIQSAHRNADNLGTICHSLQRPTKTVLCLDNFETPWEPSETRAKVEDILSTLASISNLTLIITLRGTQRPAKIAWTKPLLPPLDTLSLSGSEVIVQEIVGFMDDDIHRLLDSVDGVPLAVTLISYLIRDGEPPHSLWKRWPTERTKKIERGGDDPQSNLDASISLSIYSPRMRKDLEAIQILAALSLLPDGFPASDGSLDALQTHTAAKNIHRSLQTLRSVALVTTDEKAGHPRLRMLSPVRLFCQQSLTKEVSQSLNGMTSYYIQIIKTAKYRYYIASLYASVQPEVKNIHAVFQKAFNEGYPDTESLINATIYVTSWSRYVGYMFDDTIQLAHTHSKNSPKLRAECLRAMGLLYHVWNRLDNAEHSFTQAFELYKADNNTYGQGTALKSLGDINILRNQLDDAERTLNQAQNLFKQAQSRKGEANGLRSLAELYSRRDQILDAETALNKALDYYELSKNTSGQLYVQDRLGALNLRRDRLDEAALSFSRAIELSIQNCNVTGEANALLHIGDLFMRRDRLDDARVALERAQTLYKQTQNIVGETNVLNCLGWLSIRLDRLADAEIILRTAGANTSNALAEGNSLWYLGCAYTRMNQLEDAELALSKAQKKYDEAQNASGKAYVLGHLAAVTCGRRGLTLRQEFSRQQRSFPKRSVTLLQKRLPFIILEICTPSEVNGRPRSRASSKLCKNTKRRTLAPDKATFTGAWATLCFINPSLTKRFVRTRMHKHFIIKPSGFLKRKRTSKKSASYTDGMGLLRRQRRFLSPHGCLGRLGLSFSSLHIQAIFRVKLKLRSSCGSSRSRGQRAPAVTGSFM